MKASADNRPQKLRRSSSGFTLIELMVTIAVLATIVGIAAPNISTQLANQRVKSTAATLANALTEAKVESVLRRQNISVVYGNSSAPKTIKLQANGSEISSYNISDKSTVTQTITPSTVTNIVFQPNKRIANNATVVYTICDSGSNSETPRQVSLTNIANVNTTNAGSC
ncbi:prepilin-type N-terminal cleavage/methylation domain-containing protein [Psychrobacter sp. ANT_H59]|uniref:prepilin-type N-terminal cleavage/methylation domain-containing protein n=1 Tax=Psychrobacter sp. ANT_H59 TaxID=2597354 RepID=UPI0011EF954B|nr:prepilin-type N-terminal cleavage/methylation domain-containing protein [Psychrobacter sp. ANT_H59]KAA0938915.1 prepilin-type N-terminal cleavage/methylation domain-containing protein [Psychrobacter sp. ANT_H59]